MLERATSPDDTLCFRDPRYKCTCPWKRLSEDDLAGWVSKYWQKNRGYFQRNGFYYDQITLNDLLRNPDGWNFSELTETQLQFPNALKKFGQGIKDKRLLFAEQNESKDHPICNVYAAWQATLK